MPGKGGERYERDFARMLGGGRAFAFWKGRVALYAALRALGVGEGDEVILPGYTCVMAVSPVVYVGATPVFVDIEPETFNIDPERIEAAVTPRTKVLVAQHTYGYPARLDVMVELTRKHNLTLIEDCCLALGSRWDGERCGTFGQAAYFSFQWNKPYTSGLGGMLYAGEEEFAAQVRELCARELVSPGLKEVGMLSAQLAVYRTAIYPRTTALAQNLFRFLTRKGMVVGSSSTCEFKPVKEPDFFKGMSGRQAASGRRQLHKLDANVAHRRRMTQLYAELLAPHGFTPPELPAQADPALVRYPVRVADKERALAEAARHFVELGSWFECPLHPIETPLEAFGYQPGRCPVAERACREVVNLPLHPRANEATVRRSVAFIAGIGPAPEG